MHEWFYRWIWMWEEWWMWKEWWMWEEWWMWKDEWMNEWMGLDIHVDEINECMRKMRKRAPVWTDKCPIKLCSKHILKFKLPGSERQHSCFT